MLIRKLAVAAGLASVIALGASPSSAQETKIRFFTIFDAPRVELWEPVIAAFEEANPGITVEHETVAGSGAALYPDVLRTSMASGDPADVFFMWGGEIAGPFIRAGQVLPLDKYYEEYGWDSRFADWILARLKVDGQTYGVPLYARGMALWYRKDIFEKFGIAEPTSYDELEGICTKLKGEGIYCASFGGKFGWHTMRLLDYFVEKTCGPEIHDQIFSLSTDWDQPCVVEAYGLLKKWVDEEWLVPDFLSVSPDDSRIPLFIGDAAMVFEGPWMQEVLVANEQDLSLYDFFLPPTDQDPQRYPAFPEQWMISKESKNHDAAAKFIDFITSPEAQKANMGAFAGSATSGVVPDCDEAPFSCKWAEILGSDRQTYQLSDQAYQKELVDAFFEVQDGVVAGRYSPEEAASTMQEKSEAWKKANPG